MDDYREAVERREANDAYFGSELEGADLAECAECGHLHFDQASRSYLECTAEGCTCPFRFGW